jgi:hypothetical protein
MRGPPGFGTYTKRTAARGLSLEATRPYDAFDDRRPVTIAGLAGLISTVVVAFSR